MHHFRKQGDADLYVRFGEETVVDGTANPTPNDCKGITSYSNESCDNLQVQGQTALYVAIHAYSTYSHLTLLCEEVGAGAPQPAGCLPIGAGCEADSECCSNKCKGKPGSKTCK